MQKKEKSAGKTARRKVGFQGLQSEFKKIVWTDRNDTDEKQTVVVRDRTVIFACDHQCNGFIYSRRH